MLTKINKENLLAIKLANDRIITPLSSIGVTTMLTGSAARAAFGVDVGTLNGVDLYFQNRNHRFIIETFLNSLTDCSEFSYKDSSKSEIDTWRGFHFTITIGGVKIGISLPTTIHDINIYPDKELSVQRINLHSDEVSDTVSVGCLTLHAQRQILLAKGDKKSLAALFQLIDVKGY